MKSTRGILFFFINIFYNLEEEIGGISLFIYSKSLKMSAFFRWDVIYNIWKRKNLGLSESILKLKFKTKIKTDKDLKSYVVYAFIVFERLLWTNLFSISRIPLRESWYSGPYMLTWSFYLANIIDVTIWETLTYDRKNKTFGFLFS
jgi:hypothetical protein